METILKGNNVPPGTDLMIALHGWLRLEEISLQFNTIINTYNTAITLTNGM